MDSLRIALSMLLLLLGSTVAADDQQTVIYVEPDQLDQYWQAIAQKAPKYPRRQLEEGREGCVAVSFIIESTGRTSGHTPLATTSGDVFTRAAVKAAKSYRFEAAEQNPNGAPVLTFKTFAFAVGADEGLREARRTRLSVRCTDAALVRISELTSSP